MIYDLCSSIVSLLQSHGWCPKGNTCPQSHDIDRILDTDVKKKRKRKRKVTYMPLDTALSCSKADTPQADVNTQRQLTDDAADQSMDVNCDESEMNTKDTTTTRSPPVVTSAQGQRANGHVQGDSLIGKAEQVRRTGGHRAGFDSFMTGYAFACAICKLGVIPTVSSEGQSLHLDQLSIDDLKNKVALGGKDIPLLIQKSHFAKTSAQHKQKIQRLKASKPTDYTPDGFH